MSDQNGVIKRVHSALEHEPRVNLRHHPVKIGYTDGAVVLDGEVGNVAAKKLALELAAAVEGVRGVVDRLRVAPAERRGDGAVRESVCSFLQRESEFRRCAIRILAKGQVGTLQEGSGDGACDIEVEVSDGVVVLDGIVSSQSHKRLAGVLAWWAPGCRDVVNSLAVEPPEEDTDDEVVDALRLALEMDPLVQAEQISASCRNYVVTLEGFVRTEEERRQVELDAWCLFAVDKVINRIGVRK